MPDDTDILGLPLILPAQAQKHVTHNEALLALDVLVQLAVINRDQTVPPALATLGDRHIVPAGATLDWAGQAGKVAVLTETGWQFHAPNPGWQAYVLADAEVAVFDGIAWNAASEGNAQFAQLGVSATPDATNRLAVSSPATLLNHAGAGHQLKLNKATAGDTASLLFQTGFSGRAEMGTAGSDAFAVKVSADGSAWNTAFAADPLSGEVTFPKPVLLGGQAADPASPVDGALWLNTTSGEVKVRSNGATVVVGAGGGGGVSDGDKGDITVSGSGATWSVDAGAITNAKLADMSTARLKGRATAGTGGPEDLTGTQATALLDTFTTSLKGLAPASGGGTTNFLRADGSWAAPAAGGVSDGDKGDITVSGTGATWTVDAGAITLAKLANVATGTLFYRKTAGTGVPEVQTLTTLKTDLGLTGTNSGDQTISLIGDISGTGTSTISANIAAGAVTNGKLASMATARLKGRATAGSGEPEDLTGTQATALMDTFTTALKGLAPASGGGTANFLRADGTWASPGGGGSAPVLTPHDFWTETRFGSATATSPDHFAGATISSGTNSTALPSGAGLGLAQTGVFLRSSTTANGGYRYTTSSITGDYFGVISHRFRGIVQWKTAFTGRLVRIGYHDTIGSTDAVDGAYFEITDATCVAKTASNSTRTSHATTITLALDTLYIFDIEVNAAGTSARFRVYSGTNTTALMDVTITTNLPNTNARTFGAGLVATESSTTASDMVILHMMGTGTVAGYQRATGDLT